MSDDSKQGQGELPSNKLAACNLNEIVEPLLSQAYRDFYQLESDSLQRHEMIPIQVGAEKVMVQFFYANNARHQALLCHGYYDHVGIYGHVIEYCLSRGISVVTCDQPGHGLSSGARADIDSFDRYIEVIRAVRAFACERGFQDHWHILGQSMGGSIAMEYAHRSAAGLDAIVLLAPLVRPYGWWLSRWYFSLVKHFIEARPRTFTNNADNPAFLSFVRQDPLQPQTLPVTWVQAMVAWFTRFETYPTSGLSPMIVQGKKDKTVAWRYNFRFLKDRYPGAKWLELPNAGHHLVNENPEIRQAMWRFLDQELAENS